MNNKLKTVLAGITMIPCTILAVACGENPPPSNINQATPAQYTNLHSELELFDDENEYLEMQGKIEDILQYGHLSKDCGVYSNGIFYEYGATEYMDGTECIEWNIGKNLKLIDFEDNTLIVENTNGELLAYQNVSEEINNVTTRKLYSKKLNCGLSNYRGIEIGNRNLLDYYYVENNTLKLHSISIEDNSQNTLLDVYVNIDYKDHEGEECLKAKDIYKFGDYFFTVLENNFHCGINKFYNSEDNEHNKVIKYCYDQTANLQMYNVSKIYVADNISGSLVSVNGDNNYLYFYNVNNADDEQLYKNEQTWYNEATKVQLPTGYTIQNIKSCVLDKNSTSPQILFEMGDGEYFICKSIDISFSELGDTLQLTKIEGLKDVMATNKSKKIYMHSKDIMILMDDKNLYEFDY